MKRAIISASRIYNIDILLYIHSSSGVYTMTKLKKISTNIPAELLRKACDLTNLNQTETLIAGLKDLIAQRERETIVD